MREDAEAWFVDVGRNEDALKFVYFPFNFFNGLVQCGQQQAGFFVENVVVGVGDYLVAEFVGVVGNVRKVSIEVCLELAEQAVIGEEYDAMDFFLGGDLGSCQ